MPLQSLTESDQSLDQHPDVYQFHCALRGVDLHKIYLSRSHAGGHILAFDKISQCRSKIREFGIGSADNLLPILF